MTYREILNRLQSATSEQLNQDASVRWGEDEFTSVIWVGESCGGDPADGILDEGHLYFDVVGSAKG